MTSVLAICAAGWAIVMGLAPLLQIRRMWRRRSSADVSLGYLLILPPGFALWVAYGVAAHDNALIAPNVVALAVGIVAVGCALWLRGGHRTDRGPVRDRTKPTHQTATTVA